MTPDNAAAIVATVLRSETATAYSPTNPNFGIIVMVDEVWLGTDYVEYVRIDGLGIQGHATSVTISTTAGSFTPGHEDASDPNDREVRIANRVLSAINAVIVA